jgi:hypothetical protein
MKFKRTPKEDVETLKKVKMRLLEDMYVDGPGDEDYPTKLEYLERVAALESKDKRRVSPDAVVKVVGTLLSILAIVAYEQKHVFTSRGQNFIPKLD